MKSYWTILKKYSLPKKKSDERVEVSVITSPMGRMGYTGAGADGKVQPREPAGIVPGNNGPVMVHEGEGMVRTPNDMMVVLPHRAMEKMEGKMPGMYTGGTVSLTPEQTRTISSNIASGGPNAAGYLNAFNTGGLSGLDSYADSFQQAPKTQSAWSPVTTPQFASTADWGKITTSPVSSASFKPTGSRVAPTLIKPSAITTNPPAAPVTPWPGSPTTSAWSPVVVPQFAPDTQPVISNNKQLTVNGVTYDQFKSTYPNATDADWEKYVGSQGRMMPTGTGTAMAGAAGYVPPPNSVITDNKQLTVNGMTYDQFKNTYPNATDADWEKYVGSQGRTIPTGTGTAMTGAVGTTTTDTAGQTPETLGLRRVRDYSGTTTPTEEPPPAAATVTTPAQLSTGDAAAQMALGRLMQTMNGVSEYDRRLMNMYLQQYDTSSAAGIRAMAQRMATDPNLSEDARRSLMFGVMRYVSSGRSQLLGNMAMTSAQRQDQAVRDVFNFGSQMGNEADRRSRADYDDAVAAGDYERAAAIYKERTGQDIDVTTMKKERDLNLSYNTGLLTKLNLEVEDIKDTAAWNKFLRAAEYGNDSDVAYYYKQATGRDLGDAAMIADTRAYIRGTRINQLAQQEITTASMRQQLGDAQWESMVNRVNDGADLATINAELTAQGKAPLTKGQYDTIYGATERGRTDRLQKIETFQELAKNKNWTEAATVFKDITGVTIDFTSTQNDIAYEQLDKAGDKVDALIADAYNLGLDETAEGKQYIAGLMNMKGTLIGRQWSVLGAHVGTADFQVDASMLENTPDGDVETVLSENPTVANWLKALVGAGDFRGSMPSTSAILDHFMTDDTGKGAWATLNNDKDFQTVSTALFDPKATAADQAKALQTVLPVITAIWNEQVNGVTIKNPEIKAQAEQWGYTPVEQADVAGELMDAATFKTVYEGATDQDYTKYKASGGTVLPEAKGVEAVDVNALIDKPPGNWQSVLEGYDSDTYKALVSSQRVVDPTLENMTTIPVGGYNNDYWGYASLDAAQKNGTLVKLGGKLYEVVGRRDDSAHKSGINWSIYTLRDPVTGKQYEQTVHPLRYNAFVNIPPSYIKPPQ